MFETAKKYPYFFVFLCFFIRFVWRVQRTRIVWNGFLYNTVSRRFKKNELMKDFGRKIFYQFTGLLIPNVDESFWPSVWAFLVKNGRFSKSRYINVKTIGSYVLGVADSKYDVRKKYCRQFGRLLVYKKVKTLKNIKLIHED